MHCVEPKSRTVHDFTFQIPYRSIIVYIVLKRDSMMFGGETFANTVGWGLSLAALPQALEGESRRGLRLVVRIFCSRNIRCATLNFIFTSCRFSVSLCKPSICWKLFGEICQLLHFERAYGEYTRREVIEVLLVVKDCIEMYLADLVKTGFKLIT